MKFMDFCSGIGGGRLGLEQCGLECVAHSEIDDAADRTYRLFFGVDEVNFGDLTTINTNDIPNFDVLIGGFPCQTFSIVGKREGFADSRGQIIYGLIRILTQKNIPYFILENVKGLVNHDGGKTIRIIVDELFKAGYYVEYKVLNSQDYGVPQLRERVYFLGVKKELYKKPFLWPQKVETPDLKEYLCDPDGDILDCNDPTFRRYISNKYNVGRIKLDEILSREYLVLDTRQSDLRLYQGKTPTLRTGRHGILYVKNGKLHKLSGYEALLLQGFPRELAQRAKKFGVNNGRLLSQAGNAMSVPVIAALGNTLLDNIYE